MSENPRRSVAAIGIVVHDLERAVDFYTSIIGMQEVQRLDLPDSNLIEAVLTFPDSRGAAVLLMHYTDATSDSVVERTGKIVLRIGDCAGVTETARAAGHEIIREPGEVPGFGVIAMVKDPDGHTVELMGA